MIVELDRDPHLYPDGNIVEVSPERLIRANLIKNVFSGLGRRVSNRLLTVLRSDGRGINQHGSES